MLLSIRESWSQIMAIREARWLLSAVGLLILLLVGFYLFKLFRDIALGDASFGPAESTDCLLYTSPSPRDLSTSRMPSSA